MKVDRLLKFMASTMNASKNTVVSMFGVIVQKFLTTWLLVLLLTICVNIHTFCVVVTSVALKDLRKPCSFLI